jgi:hypothetical protein
VHEGKVLVWVTLPADAEPAELVQPGEAALHDPALGAEPGAVVLTTPGDQGSDPAGPELTAVFVVVIAPVGEQLIGALTGTADLAGDRHDAVNQGQQLGDVVAIAAGQCDRQRQPAAVGQQVVL